MTELGASGVELNSAARESYTVFKATLTSVSPAHDFLRQGMLEAEEQSGEIIFQEVKIVTWDPLKSPRRIPELLNSERIFLVLWDMATLWSCLQE